MNSKRNRKTKYFKQYFNYNNEQLEIMTDEIKKQGIYKEILNKTIQQLDLSILIHKRILVLRLDLHLNIYTGDNKRISNFMKNIKMFLVREYNIKKVGFIWVREVEKAKTQHYHLALFLNGNQIQHPKKLLPTLKTKWQPFGYTPVIPRPFYYIDKHNQKEMRKEAIYRLSYLAKIRGKGYREENAKDFNTSRLKTVI